MKKRIYLFGLLLVCLAPCTRTFAQSNTYRNVEVVHKVGQFYTSTYQGSNERAEQADPYSNDTFDESSDGWTTPTEGNYGPIQLTHEYRAVIYMHPRKTRTLTLPGNMSNSHLSMYNYQRWYDYSTDERSTAIEPAMNADLSYNFANGLVGGTFIVGSGDGHDYDRALTQVSFTMPNVSVYYLACDVSNYTDVTAPNRNSRSITEPTLSQRVIFEIHDADEMIDRLRNCTGNRYLETYDYHLPARRISSNTPEQVALELEAQNYFCPGETGDNAGALTYEIIGGGDYITGGGTISGATRVIPFTLNNAYLPANADDRKVQIRVYKEGRNGTEYNIALFNLTFDENTEGLSQTELANISQTNELYHRTNDYLDANYDLVTRLDMDYENIVYGGAQAEYHPYPMNWTYSTYGAYVNQNNKSGDPQWGEYAITKDFPWGDDGDRPLNADAGGTEIGYHLYVDANELPGTICELPFRENLCAGARLYVTAYIKSLGNKSSSQCDANLLFIVKGISGDEETILYTQASGQIPRNGSSGNHEWFQVYFSYANGNAVYDRYILQLVNNCANTRGADICLDDIRVYMNPLQVEAGITEPICAEEEQTKVQLRLNFDMLTNRLAMTQGTGETRTGYYSFLNKRIYDQTFNNNNDNYVAAFEAALVRGDRVYTNSSSQYYGQFTFNSTWNANNDNGVGHEGDGENRVITFESAIAANSGTTNSLVPGETYYIVYNASTFDPSAVTDIRSLAEIYDFSSICTVKGEFLVEGNLIVRVNGDVQADAETSCVGQIPLITVQMRDGMDGGVVEDAVFDWYFGSIDEFNQEQTTTGIDLFTALDNFRHFYPEVHAVTEDVVPVPTEEGWTLTQEEIDLIKTLNEDYGAGGSNPKLSLSASDNLTIRLLQAETPVVLIPIGTKPSEDIKICWEPTQMILYAQDTAPSLNVGRTDVDYPEGAYPQGEGVAVRMDLAQYKDLTDNNESLTVPVRDPKLGNDDATVTQVDRDLNIYLIGTNDADYIDKIGSGFDYIVGTVEDFEISQRMGAFSSGVKLKFDADKLNMKEGYEYEVTFRFKTAGSRETPEDEADLLCFGNLVVPFKIVPAYQVWIGGKDGNWNNDGNWRRADYNELNKTTENYISNKDNGRDNGFAPMMSTRIVIPTPTSGEDGSGQIELYAPTFTKVYDLTTNKPEHIGDATHLIEYDVVVRPRGNAQGIETPYFAGRYYTNQCDQIHFDVDGEMLHSELLTHSRAWTEVNVPTKQWTLVSTPLNGVYSGDWYTKTSGDETAEYFTDLKFGTDNNRLKPLMTQRSWDGNASVVSGSNNASAVVSNVTWSSTFNDVAVPYQPGMGFSIHANMGSSDDGNGVTFRMPKSDTSYEGFNDDPLARDGANFGKLATSDMAALAEGTDYEVEITPSQDGNYIIIGNPFVSHLSAKAFFEANSNVLQGKYWTANDDYPKAGVADDNGNWQTTDGTDAALIPPYTAFYAQLKSQSTQPQTIKFNTSMAALGTTASGDTPSTNGLVISAVAENGKSSTLLSYKASAENGYVTTEDVQLLNESDSEVPMVYTVAGDIATSINRIKDAQQIPLGVFAADDDVTTLTFTDVAALMEPSLYDAEMNTDTPLTEGYTLTVNGASHGRYFIRAKGAGEGTTGITDVETGDGGVSVYSVTPRQVVVSSGAELLEVSVYSVGGAMLGHESVGGGRTAVTLDGIDSGVAVVRVVTADGQTTHKLVVK